MMTYFIAGIDCAWRFRLRISKLALGSVLSGSAFGLDLQ